MTAGKTTTGSKTHKQSAVQTWLSNLTRRQDPRESFDELTDTTFDFSAFVMNRLNKSTKPQQKNWTVGSTPKAANILFHHFINNNLEYLRGGESSRKYSTSVTKTTAADYGHIKWIEDLVPNSMWSQMIVKYDKFALWGISH
ncbi:hypothetical protein Tco_0274091 [Tanacetum coccineum]